jgi:hypothetical protein
MQSWCATVLTALRIVTKARATYMATAARKRWVT